MNISAKNIKSDIQDIQAPSGMRLLIDADEGVLHDVEIPVKPNYYDGFAQEARPVIRARLGTYLCDSTADTFPADDLCPEMPVPKHLAQHLKLTLPDSVRAGTHAIALIHAGRKGCVAPLHFDWDHDNVLHACLSGTRTFFLFPPDAGWMLNPIINTSAFCFARFSPEDRDELLKKLGGQKVILRPGEAVFFPSMWWHCVYYDEASVGMSVRFADRTDLRPFSVLPRSWWLQRVVGEIFAQKMPPTEVEKIFLECSKIFFAGYPTWQDRYHAFTSWCREYLSRMDRQNGTRYWIDEVFNPELVLAGFELEELYSLPTERATSEKADEIKAYLFEAFPSLKSLPAAMALAQYALTTRNGLPAERGLIPIEYEKSSQ